MKTFRSFAEYKEYYFPKQVEKEKLAKLRKNPSEYGKYLANKAIEKQLRLTSIQT